MYLAFYGLAEKPFSITPDPRYLFLSGHHAEALAHLVYGIDEAGGFIQLTGEVGTGKTTVIRSLLARAPKNAEIALILNPRMGEVEFILTVCEELGIGVPDDALGSVKELSDILNRYLLHAHAAGRRVVLVVDEAQNLTPGLLEQVRLLTNLETESQKLLQIILIGQPELREVLARNDLRQVAQRITGRYHLRPLSRSESVAYVKHRLRVAGATTDIFTGPAMRALYSATGGIPRLINVVADRALLGGYTEDRHRVTAGMVRRAAREVFDRRTPAWVPWALGAFSLALLASGIAAWMLLHPAAPAPEPADAPAAAAPTPDVPSPDALPVSTTTAPEPAPGLRPLAEVLDDPRASADVDSAYARLFALWHATYQPGAEMPCVQALRQGLECVAGQGGIDDLRRFDRPALVELTLGDGRQRAVVAALDPAAALLQLGPLAERVTLDELAAAWTGDYVLLWRPPELDTRALTLGMRGSTVRELRARLAHVLGRPSVTDGDASYFDAPLERDVREFQRARGLGVDGIAGAQTQLALDAALRADGTPLLQAQAAAPPGHAP